MGIKFFSPAPPGKLVSYSAFQAGNYYMAAGIVDGWIYLVGTPISDGDATVVQRRRVTGGTWEIVYASKQDELNDNVCVAFDGVGKFYSLFTTVGGSEVRVYDVRANSWSAYPAPFSRPAGYPTTYPLPVNEGVVVGSKYVIIQFTGTKVPYGTSAYIYDIMTHSWSSAFASPYSGTTRPYGSPPVVIDGVAYVATAAGLEIFNPTTRTWTRKRGVVTSVLNAMPVAIGNAIYWVGSDKSTHVIQREDLSSGVITADIDRPYMGYPTVTQPVAVADGNDIHIFGGWGYADASAGSIVYNVASKTWVDGIVDGDYGPAVLKIGNRAYVSGESLYPYWIDLDTGYTGWDKSLEPNAYDRPNGYGYSYAQIGNRAYWHDGTDLVWIDVITGDYGQIDGLPVLPTGASYENGRIVYYNGKLYLIPVGGTHIAIVDPKTETSVLMDCDEIGNLDGAPQAGNLSSPALVGSVAYFGTATSVASNRVWLGGQWMAVASIDLATGRRTVHAKIPKPLVRVSQIAIGAIVYLFGNVYVSDTPGGDIRDGLNPVYIAAYDTRSGTLSEFPDQPYWSQLSYATPIEYNGTIFLLGGVTTSQVMGTGLLGFGLPKSSSYLRMTQRDDGLGVVRSSRLQLPGRGGGASAMTPRVPRLNIENRYR